LPGTEEIMLIHHTDCGMFTFSDDDFRHQLQHEAGIKTEWPAETSTTSRFTTARYRP
jgi:carbonic anhydrase